MRLLTLVITVMVMLSYLHDVNGQKTIKNLFDDISISCEGVQVRAKVNLQGPYNSSNNLMQDNLRTANLIPTTEPYTALGYSHVNGGGESIAPELLSSFGSGTDMIIDWVVLELRDMSGNTVATRSALLQQDGDIVDVDGKCYVSFYGIGTGQSNVSYRVAVRHRNHLGVSTANPIVLPVGVDCWCNTAQTPSFFDYVRYYNAIMPDTTEGSFASMLNKRAIHWGERLHPTGFTHQAAQAINNYAATFNMNRKSSGGSTPPPMPSCITGNWQCIGPTGEPVGTNSANGTGQMHVIKFSPNYTSDQTVYAGTNWGGLWRRIGTNDWEELNTDFQIPFTSVSDIEINPFNTNILYITTGDAEMTLGHHAQNPNAAPTSFTPVFTSGVLRSTNGGNSWFAINGANEELLSQFTNGGTIRRIRLNPNNTNQLFIATSEGVFRCDNANASEPSWIKVSTFTDFELKGLELKPNDSNTIYTSGRDIYESTDSGNSWNTITGIGTGLDLLNLPNDFSLHKINITVTPANSDVIYAYIIGRDVTQNANGDDVIRMAMYIYKYNGASWSQIHFARAGSGANTFLNAAWTSIAASPSNENEVYFGTSVVYGGMDVTTSVNKLTEYFDHENHADVHALAFEPNTNNLYIGTDGGVHTKDLTNTSPTSGVADISDGLQVSAPYGMDDTEGRSDRIMMGNQDTGTVVYENGVWRIILGGDGFDGNIDEVTGTGYGSQNTTTNRLFSYDFDIPRRRSEFGTNQRPDDPNIWVSSTNNSKALIRGTYDMVNHPITGRLYFTMSELFERLKNEQRDLSDNTASLWNVKSNIGETPETRDWWKRQFLTELDIAPTNPDFMLMGLNGIVVDLPDYLPGGIVVEPRLYRTIDGGCNGIADYASGTPCFEEITDSLITSGITNSSYTPFNTDDPGSMIPIITGIVINPENHLEAWVTFTGYEPTAKVWKTTDGGSTWTNADPNQSLINLPVNEIVYQLGTNNRLYIATDAGVYYKDDSMSDWEGFCDFPNVRVTDLKINYCMGKIRAATFGRSVWEGDLLPSTNQDLGDAALLIKNSTTWTDDRGMGKNIKVLEGNTLTIDGATVSMPMDGKIIVEAGAELRVINGGTITNNCGQMWEGIEVRGRKTFSQTPTTPQGRLILNNATIEYARNAISVDENSLGIAGGGVINADNTTFYNNKRSVEYMQYLFNNSGYFNNCTFTIDDNYRTNSFIAHITMWDVKGIEITDCTFSHNHTTLNDRGYGIYSLNAAYTVRGTSSFNGFQGGVYCNNSGSANTVDIKSADFQDNAVGVYADNVDNVVIGYSTFGVGQRVTPILRHGIYIDNSTGFIVEENTITGNTIGIGVQCENTGDLYNRIYNNDFSNLATGNLSIGDNRDNNNNFAGLEYRCNDNMNNTYDFIVDKDNSIASNLSGIRQNQGDVNTSAGNTFTLNTSPAGSDFDNRSDWNIVYWFGTEPNGQLSNTNGLVKVNTNKFNSCATTLPTLVLDPNKLEELNREKSNECDAERNDYYARIDNGQSEGLANLLAETNAENNDAIKSQLLSIAPWLSEQTVSSFIEKATAFDDEDFEEVLLANPDVLRNPVMRDKLRGAMEADEYQDLIQRLDNTFTERTYQEMEIAECIAQEHTNINMSLHLELMDDDTDNDEVVRLLRAKGSIQAHYGLVNFLLQSNSLVAAQDAALEIPILYSLTDYQQLVYSDFMRLLDVHIAYKQAERQLNELNETEVNTLVDLAERGHGKAKSQARAILNFFYGYDYEV